MEDKQKKVIYILQKKNYVVPIPTKNSSKHYFSRKERRKQCNKNYY